MEGNVRTAIASASGGGGYSSVLINQKCTVRHLLVQCDGTNDPTITIRDNSSASGDPIIPAVAYDASMLGLNGVRDLRIPIDTSLHVVITCAGAAKLFVYYL